MKDYEDEAFDDIDKAQQRKVATGVTDGSKVTIDRAKLEQVLEALETAWYHVNTFWPTDEAIELYDEARAAIKESLAQPEQEHDLSEQGRNRSAVLGNNIEAMMESGLSFLKALETTLKVYDHAVPKPPTALRSKT